MSLRTSAPLRTRSLSLVPLSISACLVAAPAAAQSQATVKPDGEFRYALGAGGSWASGNTESTSVNIDGEGVRATADSKFRFGGKALWTRDDGRTTAERIGLGTQYDRDLTPVWFGFGSADFLRDKFANISARYAAHGGIGYHVVKSERDTFDLTAGLGYTEDRYVDAVDVHGETRERYGRPEAVFGEESTHKVTDTTSVRQKLSIFPALRSGGGWRGVFDAGLAVAMTPRLALTLGFVYRYDSDPGNAVAGGSERNFKHSDTLLVTGIALKFD